MEGPRKKAEGLLAGETLRTDEGTSLKRAEHVDQRLGVGPMREKRNRKDDEVNLRCFRTKKKKTYYQRGHGKLTARRER